MARRRWLLLTFGCGILRFRDGRGIFAFGFFDLERAGEGFSQRAGCMRRDSVHIKVRRAGMEMGQGDLHCTVLDGQGDRRIYFATRPDTADGHGAIREGATKASRATRTGGFFITPSHAVRDRVLEIDFRRIVHGCCLGLSVPGHNESLRRGDVERTMVATGVKSVYCRGTSQERHDGRLFYICISSIPSPSMSCLRRYPR